MSTLLGAQQERFRTSSCVCCSMLPFFPERYEQHSNPCNVLGTRAHHSPDQTYTAYTQDWGMPVVQVAHMNVRSSTEHLGIVHCEHDIIIQIAAFIPCGHGAPSLSCIIVTWH